MTAHVRTPRGAFAAITFGVVCVCFQGCRDIVAGDNIDVATELCELLEQCGDPIDCEGDVVQPMREFSTSQFLLNAEAVDCLGGCANARLCRDFLPVCTNTECDVDAQCCGFTAGRAVCGVDGACCRRAGVACGGEGDPSCCGDLGCNDGYCGDVICRELDAACDVGQQCCSERCEGGACVPNTCEGLGEPCVLDTDCCGIGLRCGDGLCVPDDACVCDPFAVDTCCPGDEVCFSVGDDVSTCAPISCPPVGAECGSNEDCLRDGPGCDALQLFCDFSFIPYCAECLGPGAPCNDLTAGACCGTALCIEGACQE